MLDDFEKKKVKRKPTFVRTGNDTEYLGKCNEYYSANDITHEQTPRYSPWRNGKAESVVQAIERRTTPSLLARTRAHSLTQMAKMAAESPH